MALDCQVSSPVVCLSAGEARCNDVRMSGVAAMACGQERAIAHGMPQDPVSRISYAATGDTRRMSLLYGGTAREPDLAGKTVRAEMS